jgi:hypothetical protein
MATFNKEIKSNRLLQSKRYTIQNIDGQEAYTNVLDLNSSEIYTQQAFLPTSSLPYSSSAQDGLYITSGSGAGETNIAQYYYRIRLKPVNPLVTSAGVEGGNNAQVWVPISGAADYNPITGQSIQPGQVVNWVSNKYIAPNLNTLRADVLTSGDTPGYNIVLFTGDINNPSVVDGNYYQFDYKTGVIQFTTPANAPSSTTAVYLSGYVYVGKTLADETFGGGSGGSGAGFPFSGSAVITGSLLVSGSALTISGSSNFDGAINATSVTSSFKGDLDGTASTASYVETAQTASFVTTAQTASFVETAQTASYVETAQTASFVVTAQTASYVETSQTASYVAGANVDGAVANATNAASAAALDTDATGTNLTLSGNLSVAGTASFTHSTNLAIKDKYVLLSSGSTSAGDGGIVVQQAADGVGKLFGYDSATGRWAITSSFDADTSADFQPDAYVSMVISGSTLSQVSSSLVYNKKGNVFVDSSNDAYIFADDWQKLLLSGDNIVVGTISASGQLESNGAIISGTLAIEGISDVSASIAALTSAEDNAGIFNQVGSSDAFAATSSLQVTGSTLLQTPVSGSNPTAASDGTSSDVAKYAMSVSESIWAYNHNVGVPKSNAWQTGLAGSYFNRFNHNTDTSEILRFIAGLLADQAPDVSENTNTFTALTSIQTNATAFSIPTGVVPNGTNNADITHLISKGFAAAGSTLFNGVTLADTANHISNSSFSIKYNNISSGNTTVSSSAGFPQSGNTRLIGLGDINSTVNVVGTIDFRFEDNTSSTQTATTQTTTTLTNSTSGTTAQNITLATIPTVNPQIAAKFQDGVFTNAFENTMYNNSVSFSSIASTGYYDIDASIVINGGTARTAAKRVLYTPTLSSIGTNSLSNQNLVANALTATSRSLSGAPYLLTATYETKTETLGMFDPLFVASSNAVQMEITSAPSNTTLSIAATSGKSLVLDTSGNDVGNANTVYDSTGATPRNINAIPDRTDLVRLEGDITFNAGTSRATNMNDGTYTTSNFAVNTFGRTRSQTGGTRSTIATQTIDYIAPGGFGNTNPKDNAESMAYYGFAQGNDNSTIGTISAASEDFSGEDFRVQLTNNALKGSNADADKFPTTYDVSALGAYDLQVTPGHLVRPGSSKGYWLDDPDSTKDYKWYARAFQCPLTGTSIKTKLIIDVGQTLKRLNETTAGVSVAVILQSAGSNQLSTPRIFDMANGSSDDGNKSVSDNGGQFSPFSNTANITFNEGLTISGTAYTLNFLDAKDMFLNATYQNFIVLVRYKGVPTSVEDITISY